MTECGLRAVAATASPAASASCAINAPKPRDAPVMNQTRMAVSPHVWTVRPGADIQPPSKQLVVRFWLLWRSAARNSADRRGQLPSKINTMSAQRIESLRCGTPRQTCELFQRGLGHAYLSNYAILVPRLRTRPDGWRNAKQFE